MFNLDVSLQEQREIMADVYRRMDAPDNDKTEDEIEKENNDFRKTEEETLMQ